MRKRIGQVTAAPGMPDFPTRDCGDKELAAFNAEYARYAAPIEALESEAIRAGHFIQLGEGLAMIARGARLYSMQEHAGYWMPGFEPPWIKPAAVTTQPRSTRHA